MLHNKTIIKKMKNRKLVCCVMKGPERKRSVIQTKKREIMLYSKEEEMRSLKETSDARAYRLEKLINKQQELVTEK